MPLAQAGPLPQPPVAPPVPLDPVAAAPEPPLELEVGRRLGVPPHATSTDTANAVAHNELGQRMRHLIFGFGSDGKRAAPWIHAPKARQYTARWLACNGRGLALLERPFI